MSDTPTRRRTQRSTQPTQKQAASFHHAPVCTRGNAQHSPAVGRQAAAAAAAPTPLMQQRRATTPPPRGCKLPRCLVFWFVGVVGGSSINRYGSLKAFIFSYSHNCSKTVEEDEEHALFGSLFCMEEEDGIIPPLTCSICYSYNESRSTNSTTYSTKTSRWC
jgi:hypothetical protein